MRTLLRTKILPGVAAGLIIGLTSLIGSSVAQEACPPPIAPEKPNRLLSLKGVQPPLPAALDTVVKNRAVAIALGKAFFWDKQVGSDGQACASCHFHAGADNRIKNQLSPGLRAVPPDTLFNPTKTGGKGPNYTMRAGDYPFHALSDPLDRNSSILFDTNDVTSSQGTFTGVFIDFFGSNSEACTADAGTTPFKVGTKLTRKVEPRNTPTTVNAIFQFRSFWDGRANNHFNGQSIWGRRDVTARVFESQGTSVATAVLDLENAALASQAVGPLLSPMEMSCEGRSISLIGRKLFSVPRALSNQKVDQADSVLGPYADLSHGLKPVHSYRALIQQAFHDKYWNNTAWRSADGFTQMEANFAMFWGLAVMLYESTLVSDDAPFDRYVGNPTTPPDLTALTAQQIAGMQVFIGKGKCVNCHKGPDMTGAGLRLQAEFQESGIVEHMRMGDNRGALYDNGFYNIGARPTEDDLGLGAGDPFGNPLSFTKQFKRQIAGHNAPDPFQINPCTFEVEPCTPVTDPNHRDAVDGAFKTPSLRNAELTGPYMHNGGMSTLEQVVAFYNRGGDRRGPNNNDTTGHGNNHSNLDPDITTLGLSGQEQADLVAFIKSLTDDRVRCEKAPFDHPELKVFNGHRGDQISIQDLNFDGKADDLTKTLPAVGATGLPGKGLACLKPFSDGLQ